MSKESKFRMIVSHILEEQGEMRLKRDLVNVTCLLTMATDAHVPDTLTRIRVLPTVSVVGQKEPVQRTPKGKTMLEIYIKYLPRAGSDYKNLLSLSKLVKRLPGVKIVRILTLDGRKVTFKGRPIVM